MGMIVIKLQNYILPIIWAMKLLGPLTEKIQQTNQNQKMLRERM